MRTAKIGEYRPIILEHWGNAEAAFGAGQRAAMGEPGRPRGAR
jgi:hypothetical protein